MRNESEVKRMEKVQSAIEELIIVKAKALSEITSPEELTALAELVKSYGMLIK